MYDNTVSARTYLSYIAEQAGGIAVIGRDGKLYIKTIGESSVTLPLKLFKTFKWGEKFKITRVRYDDGIQLFEKGDTTGNTVYISQDNMYIVDQDQINNIYNALKGLEFYSFEGESIIDPALDTGDIVVIDGKNVIYQGSMQFSGRWIANIESKIQCKAKEETTTRTPSQRTINRRVESNINQIDGKITQLTEETTENTQKITKVEQDVNGITSKVSSVEQSVENITKIEGTAEGKNIYIDDASAEPLIDIMLEGESQQAASPSPDNLSEIKNLEGENICPSLNTTRTINGVTFTKNKNGSITMNGTATAEAKYPINVNTTTNTRTVLLKANSKYRMLSSYESEKYTTQVFYLKNNVTTYSSSLIETVEETKAGMYIRVYKNAVLENVTIYPQITKGEEYKPYVPYNSLKFKDEGENLYNDNIDNYNKPIDYWICPVALEQGEIYKLSGKLKGTKMTGCVVAVVPYGNSYSEFKDVVYRYTALNTSGVVSNRTITVDSSFTSPKLVIYANNKEIFKSLFENYEIQLNKGTVVRPYKPYQERKEYFPLSEGQKLYKGSYLANDGIQHKRNQVVLDGSDDEGWTLLNPDKNTYKLSNFINGNGNDNSFNYPILSNYFKSDTQANVFEGVKNTIQALGGNVNGLYISFGKDSDINRVSLLRTFLKAKYDAGTPVIVEYELAEEEIVPYTEDQKEAWEKLRHFTLFKGINNITSTANAKITYVRDNGLSDTYETKRNVKENYYTKSETDSQISQTADSIKESVKAINEQTQEKLATLELDNQSLEFATKRTGGNNLIRNSAMINDNNFWLAHAKYPYQESDTPPDNPAEGTYWYCTANSGSYIENQMYVYNSGWKESELSRKSLLSAQNYFAYTTSNEYWANGKNANENTLSGRVIKLDGRQDYTVSHIFNITEPITLNQNENKMAISYFIKNSIVQGNVCVGLMFLNEADFTEVEKPYSLYEPGIILTPDDLKDLTKIEQIIEIPKKSDFIPVVVSNTAPTDTTKNWLDTTIYLPKKYNSQTSQWEILDTKMSLYNESSREVWTYRYFYGFYYQTPIIYDTAEIKSCYVALTFYPAFAVYTGNVEPTPYKGLYWNNKTTNLVKRAKYDGTTFVEWETLDIPSSLLPTGASLGVELFDYIVPIKGFVEIADLKLEYNTMCTQWTQFPGEVYGKNYKMDEKGFWIQANQNTMFIDEDEILATYKGINIFQINKDLAYFYKIQATESIEIGNYFLKTQQINSKNMLLLY